jgi:hypothetical protein
VIVRPAGHGLVGGDVIVVPDVVEQSRVLADLSRRLEQAEALPDRRRRHVPILVEDGVEREVIVGEVAPQPPLREVDRSRHHAERAQRGLRVVRHVEQREHAAIAVAEQVDRI